jgi:hypothetical protein
MDLLRNLFNWNGVLNTGHLYNYLFIIQMIRFGGNFGLFRAIRYKAVTEIKLPAFSPTMSEGRIVNWTVKEG